MAKATTPDHSSLAAALAAAQSELTDPPKNKMASVKGKTQDGRSYDRSYAYCDIADVLGVVRPVLSRHGLAITQDVSTSDDGRSLRIATAILWRDQVHVSTLAWPMPSKIQDLGSAITYLRRYTLCATVGVAADADDDGQRANTAARPAQDRQRPTLTHDCPLCHSQLRDHVSDVRAGRKTPNGKNWPALSCSNRDCGFETIWSASDAERWLAQARGDGDPMEAFHEAFSALGLGSYETLCDFLASIGERAPDKASIDDREQLIKLLGNGWGQKLTAFAAEQADADPQHNGVPA